jgi:hypothetical protein
MLLAFVPKMFSIPLSSSLLFFFEDQVLLFLLLPLLLSREDDKEDFLFLLLSIFLCIVIFLPDLNEALTSPSPSFPLPFFLLFFVDFECFDFQLWSCRGVGQFVEGYDEPTNDGSPVTVGVFVKNGSDGANVAINVEGVVGEIVAMKGVGLLTDVVKGVTTIVGDSVVSNSVGILVDTIIVGKIVLSMVAIGVGKSVRLVGRPVVKSIEGDIVENIGAGTSEGVDVKGKSIVGLPVEKVGKFVTGVWGVNAMVGGFVTVVGENVSKNEGTLVVDAGTLVPVVGNVVPDTGDIEIVDGVAVAEVGGEVTGLVGEDVSVVGRAVAVDGEGVSMVDGEAVVVVGGDVAVVGKLVGDTVLVDVAFKVGWVVLT